MFDAGNTNDVNINNIPFPIPNTEVIAAIVYPKQNPL